MCRFGKYAELFGGMMKDGRAFLELIQGLTEVFGGI